MIFLSVSRIVNNVGVNVIYPRGITLKGRKQILMKKLILEKIL